MGIWVDIVSKDIMHVLSVRRSKLYPTQTWKEDSIYKASKISKTLLSLSVIEESI